jgi:hypothetical protein
LNTSQTFIPGCTAIFRYYKSLADKTFEQLNDDDIHFCPNETSNSVAIIVKHMAGNMLSRWTNFLTEDGEKSWRKRDDEFESSSWSKAQMIEQWEKGWDCFLHSLTSMNDDDLAKSITIRAESMTAMDAVLRQLAHYPYHVGQIIFLGKIVKDSAWQNLSIPKGDSDKFNKSAGPKYPGRR